MEIVALCRNEGSRRSLVGVIITPTLTGSQLKQTASFRPKGVLGRLYWYLLLPIHKLIFRGMARALTK